MKMGPAAGAAIVLAFGSAAVAIAGPAPVGPACHEVSGGVRASALSSSYQSGDVRLDKQRGASSCITSAAGTSCLLNDPGRVVVSSGGAVKRYKIPLLGKAKVTAKGSEIACRIVKA
jgi:hypothetical protein